MHYPSDSPARFSRSTLRASRLWAAATAAALLIGASAALAQPANDLCANAQPIGVGTIAFSTMGAGTDGPADTCTRSFSDIWYSFFALYDGVIQVNTCGSNFDTTLKIYGPNASCGALGATLACDDDSLDSACGLVSSRLSFQATAGRSYLIRLAGYSGAGTGQLTVAAPSRPTTYQGQLASGSAPVSGPVSMRFRLYDSPTDGTQLGPVSSPLAPVVVTDGLFTTSFDFGQLVWTDSLTRYLEIDVQNPPPPLGDGLYVTLSPRQPVGSAPSAISAVSATNATTATTAAQLAPGRARIRGDAGAAGNSPGIWFASPITAPVDRAFVGQRDDVNVGFFNGAWNFLLHSNGNVAIGNGSGAAPTQRLVVNGNVLANNIAVPSSGRFKHNVLPMTDALDKLLKLDGVTFDWNPDFAKDRPGREHDLGFVAEDVAKVFPEVVFYDADGKVTGMDYSRLTAVAVQAIKQQHANFTAERQTDRVRFETQLASLKAEAARRDADTAKREAENAELKTRLAAIEAALSKMTQNNK